MNRVTLLTNIVREHRQYLASGIVAALAFFFVLRIFNIIGFQYYPTINRVTYIDGFVFGSPTGAPFADSMIVLVAGMLSVWLVAPKKLALLTIAAYGALALALFSAGLAFDILALSIFPVTSYFIFSFRRTKRFSIELCFQVAILILASIEVYTLARLVIHPVYPESFYSGWSWKIADLERQIFYVAARLAPALMLLVIFSFLIKFNLQTISDSIRKVFPKIAAGNASKENSLEQKIFSRKKIWLAVMIFFTLFIPVYPYLPSLNPDQSFRATDVVYYNDWVTSLASKDKLADAIHESFFDLGGDELASGRGDRPLTLLTLLSIHKLTSIPIINVVQLFPVLLTPLLAVVSYFLVKVGTRVNSYALVAALFSVVSYHVVVGMYTGFMANWLAIIGNYGAFLFLILAWTSGKKQHYSLFIAMMIFTMLAHIHTWIYLISSISLFLVISAVSERSRATVKKAIIVAALISLTVAMDLLIGFVFSSSTGVDSNVSRATSAISLDNFASRWNNLYYSFQVWFGGFYANFVMLGLALIGILAMSWKKTFDRLIMSSVVITLLATISGDYGIQSRLFYMMPIHILAAAGVLWMLRLEWIGNRTKVSLMIFIGAYLLAYAIRSVANLELKL